MDLVESLSLDLLGEVVGDCKHVDSLLDGYRKLLHYVHSPLYEGPTREDGAESFRRKVRHLYEVLEVVAVSNIVCRV